jgi:hypothetical protein
MIGGPITYAAQPNAVTVATAVPGCSPGSRPAALNTAGTTDGSPKPLVARESHGDHGEGEPGVGKPGDGSGGTKRARLVHRGPVRGGAFTQHAGESDHRQGEHPG